MATEKQRAYRAYLRSYKKRQKNNQYQREYYQRKKQERADAQKRNRIIGAIVAVIAIAGAVWYFTQA